MAKESKAKRIERALRQFNDGSRCLIEDATDESTELAARGYVIYRDNKWRKSFSEAATMARIEIISAILKGR